jgi:hypothetical protein
MLYASSEPGYELLVKEVDKGWVPKFLMRDE